MLAGRLGKICYKTLQNLGAKTFWPIPTEIVFNLLEPLAMTALVNPLPNPLRPRHGGQTMVEFALILGLVVVMAIGALQGMGGALKTAWNGDMKPKMETPEAPMIAAKQTAPTFAEVTGTQGEQVSYDISGTAPSACWDGSQLNAVAGGNDGGANAGSNSGEC